jgi:hypothetical protein
MRCKLLRGWAIRSSWSGLHRRACGRCARFCAAQHLLRWSTYSFLTEGYIAFVTRPGEAMYEGAGQSELSRTTWEVETS